MIQGVGALGTAENPQIQMLSRQYTCLTFDNRGIGGSQPAGREITVDQMAADALALMDAVGWKSAHVVGHSLGGLTSMQLALSAKERVRTLTLLCAFARGADAVKITTELVFILLRIKLGPRRMRQQAFLELVLAPEERKGDLKAVAKRIAGVLGHDVADIPPVATQQIAAMRSKDLTKKLQELAGIPTLVINGAKDPLGRPESGRTLAGGIPGARYVEFPGTSHALPILKDVQCANLILEHLQQYGDRR